MKPSSRLVLVNTVIIMSVGLIATWHNNREAIPSATSAKQEVLVEPTATSASPTPNVPIATTPALAAPVAVPAEPNVSVTPPPATLSHVSKPQGALAKKPKRVVLGGAVPAEPSVPVTAPTSHVSESPAHVAVKPEPAAPVAVPAEPSVPVTAPAATPSHVSESQAPAPASTPSQPTQ